MTKLSWPENIKEDGVTYRFVEAYPYLNEEGILSYINGRYENKKAELYKTMRYRQADGTWGLNGQKRIPYNLPDVVNASMQIPIAICEGEKDANRLNSLGFIATTAGGANDWRSEFKEYFRGRIVELFYDNDEAGRKLRDKILNDLTGVAAEIKVIDLPSMYKDISDYLNDGHSKEELLDLIENTKPYQPVQTIFPLTDAGNAERFAAMHRDKLRYCVEHCRWYFFDRTHWNQSIGQEKAEQLAIVTARSIIDDAKNVVDSGEREKILKWAMASESATKLKAMLSLAQNIASIVCHAIAFNKDDYLLNCLNGTLELKSGKLRKHNPYDMITKVCPVKYNPDAKLPLWEKFIDDCTNGNKPLKEFLQIAVGLSLSGDISEEVLFFVHGLTASGKTTFLEAIKATLGDYAVTADFETFLKRQQVGNARNDIARLTDARFVVSIEVDEGKTLAEGLVKMITGGDTVTTRFLYKESFEFIPKFKLWLAANHSPKVSDLDDALWRRILRIPFNHSIPKEQRDPKVKATLKNLDVAGAAILAWAVEGFKLWQLVGLAVPDIVKNSTDEYRDEQDPLRDFFDDELDFYPDAFVPVSTLRLRYESWAKEQGVKYTLGNKNFNERLKSKKCVQKIKRYNNTMGTEKIERCWHGVTLASEPLISKKEAKQGVFES